MIISPMSSYSPSLNHIGSSPPSSSPMPAPETDQIKKRKRMESNRESARRCRMRKQKRLEDLRAEANHLAEANGGVAAGLSAALRRCECVKAENFVLQAQAEELKFRLRTLDRILSGSFFFPNGGDGRRRIPLAIGAGFAELWGSIAPSPATMEDLFQCC